jgi:hypothetical protein
MTELDAHLPRADVQVTSHTFYRLCGRRSAAGEIMN